MEEELIYELVDCIVNNQDKINELKRKIESPEGNDIYKKENEYKNLLNLNIKKANRYEKDKKINDRKFQEYANKFYLKMENIEKEINIIIEKLNEFDKNNPNKDLYKISYEKFKNIILNQQDKNNLKHSKKEYNKINNNYITITKDINKIEEEKNRLNELNSMIDEERDGVDIKMVDYISLKESYDEMSKQYLKHFIFEKNYNAQNNCSKELLNEINSNKNIQNLEVYYYELNICDLHKISKEISRQIIDLTNHYTKSTNIDNNNIMNIKSYENIGKSNENNDFVNILENNNNELFHSIVNKTKIFYNKNEINSLISILTSKIEKNIIDYFLSSNDYNDSNSYIENFDNLFIVLNDLIISFIHIYFPSFNNKNKNKNDSYLLILFMKCLIKSFYYQKIISGDLNFLNKEYKISKMALKTNINNIEKKYNNIKSDKEEYLISKNQLEEKMKYLNDNMNNNMYSDLSPEEKEYINMNQRLNELTNKKKKLKYDFIRYENENNYNKEQILYKIEELKTKNKLLRKNILTCQEEIKLKNHQNKLEIKKLEKSIKEKFNVIKDQISVYKKKNGDNIELYNKFVDRINESLKENNNIDENMRINDNNKKNNYISNNNSLYNTQSTFYKSNEKQNLRKSYFSPEKIQMNNYNKNIYFY